MPKILVIDDDEFVNGMIVQLLSEAGYEAEGARDGNSGLKILESKQFDLIVTDIVMPEKEGIETIIAIRNINKTLPIIAISGGGKIDPQQYLRMAQHFGADQTFQKPFDRGHFLAAIQKCLSRIQDTQVKP
ncbi:MAG TPA: response regulator [Bacteroidota bacterium]|nr:response regulator [Bacteroidota bacterium]